MALLLGVLASCSPVKFLSADESLLHAVRLVSAEKRVRPSDYRAYVRQEPNSRWFNLAKVPLAVYSLSSADTLSGRGRFFRRIGEAPVVYSAALTDYSRQNLEAALRAKGYLHARVEADTTTRRKRTRVTYTMKPGRRYYVDTIAYDFDSPRLRREADTLLRQGSLLYRGMPFDVSVLGDERNRVITALQNRGFFRLHKEFLTFRADTLRGDMGIALTMVFDTPAGVDSTKAYAKYRYRRINIFEDGAQAEALPEPALADTAAGGVTFYAAGRYAGSVGRLAESGVAAPQRRTKIRRGIYLNHAYLRPDSLFRERDVQNTYSALNGLQAISYTTIRFREVGTPSRPQLDADIQAYRNKPHSVSAELEGTNTNGDLGAAAVLTYANRNLLRGAESFQLKGRAAYEAITGLEGYTDENYFEYGIDASVQFPASRLPFMHGRRRAFTSTSGFGIQFNSQDRPEFHRRMLTGDWTFRWRHHDHPGWQHRFDVVSLNYVFMPWISSTFRTQYLEGEDPRYSILRASYDNLFIMRWGYSFVYNSRLEKARAQTPAPAGGTQADGGWQLKFNIETAGNLLRGLSALTGAKRNAQGQYELFNIAYSQYAKVDIDYSRSLPLDERNSVAWHAAFGLALPYGNSVIMPYEKRYFAGGANSVRGWSVRELGPGSYVGKDGKVDFINQTGNLKLDASVEWRTHMFWKFDGAAFIDAGNIWNTRSYANQAGGRFRFRSFHRQIAAAYGLGLRFNMDYFILRFDFGMRAIDPAYTGTRHYPLLHPNLGRDFAFHFAVGLPF